MYSIMVTQRLLCIIVCTIPLKFINICEETIINRKEDKKRTTEKIEE